MSRPKKQRSIVFERCEVRLCMAPVIFSQPKVIEVGLSLSNDVEGSVAVADFDADSDPDIVVASHDSIKWFKNIDGKATFEPQKPISAMAIQAVHLADLDGDGFRDVVSMNECEDELGGHLVAWYRNTNGNVGPQRTIGRTSQPGLGCAGYPPTSGDVDADGDLDVLAGRVWYENTDSRGAFSPAKNFSPLNNLDFLGDVLSLADLDRDGDLDMLYEAFWREDLDVKGNLGDARFYYCSVMASGDAARYYPSFADMDGDGDLDVLQAAEGAWCENDGRGSFGPGHVIERTFRAYAGDVDFDGDMDLISPSLVWYENSDGRGNLGPGRAISTQPEAVARNTIVTGDLDGDGDLDVLSGVGVLDKDGSYSHEIVWYENRGVPGDANRDGRFDSSDLGQVFQAGEYEDNTAGNSTAREGDFDGDGDFTTADLIFAFQQGNYVL